MNKLWHYVLMAGTLLCLIFRPDNLMTSLTSAVKKAVSLSVTLLPSYVIWSAVLELIRQSKIDTAMARIAAPIVNKVFPGESAATKNAVTMTFVANMLGMNGAATPLAIRAVSLMDNGTQNATKSQMLFTVINATSIALLPTTAISMRLAYGSSNAGNIILPCLIVSTIATVIGSMAIIILKK